MSLEQLQINHGLKTDKNNPHSYFSTYDKYFKPYLNKDINVLEIGVLFGESLKLWSHRFTPDSMIIGIDLFERRHCSFEQVQRNIKGYSNIILEKVDSFEDGVSQRQVRDIFFSKLRKNNIKFSIIIDDGCHRPDAQIETFNNFKPFLADNGVYIIEDIETEKLDVVKEAIPNLEIPKLPQPLIEMIDNNLGIYKS